MQHLATDAEILAREATNFERIGNELKSEIEQVSSTAEALSAQWKGLAAEAAQTALQQFQEAAARQVKALNDISTNIQTAATQYAATDDQQAQVLTSTMGDSLGGPVP